MTIATAGFDFYLTEDDSGKIMTATLRDALGAPVNLNGATVTFSVGDGCGANLIVPAAAAVPDPDQNTNTGVVRFTWRSAHTAQSGRFEGQFVAVWGGGARLTFPTDPMRIEIRRKVAA